MFSGGVGSWAAAKRVSARKLAGDDIKLVFADTKTEDDDLYRFIEEAADNVGAELVRLSDGRDVWQVFNDVKFIGNTRIDPCSRILKRSLIRKWVEEHYRPEDAVVHLGIDWTEEHRLTKAIPYWEPYQLAAPLCQRPYLSRDEVFAWLAKEGIRAPRLYDLGFVHNNCGGFCVKGGHAAFKNLLEKLPDRYAYHERKEAEFRERTGKDVAILRDRRGGTTTPLTLQDFRLRVQGGEAIDTDDIGGCACFTPDDYAKDMEAEL
jgi:3'-phosphoadenosine 5'-phosphosulfate sulfotransferase (PAPS reductase)/FAD synthetase